MLIEMLIAIGLLAIVGLLAAQVFRSVSRAWHDAAVQQSQQMRFDQIIHQLRLDVWDASSLESSEPRRLQIHLPSGQVITWKLEDVIERSTDEADSSQPRRWSDLGAELSAAVHGPEVQIDVSQGPNAPSGQFVLVSQAMLLNERQP